MAFGHPYYPNYPAQGAYASYPTPATPGGMQYGYPFPAPPGFMPQGIHPGGYAPPGGIPGYFMEDMQQEEDDGPMDEDDEVDMEMPLDQQSAEKALKHMIYTQLYMEGFDGGQASAVEHLLHEVVACESTPKNTS